MPHRPPTPPSLEDLDGLTDIEGLKRELVQARTDNFLLRGAVTAGQEQALILVELVKPDADKLLEKYADVDPELYWATEDAERAIEAVRGLDPETTPPFLAFQPAHFRDCRFRILLSNRATARAWGLQSEREAEGLDVDEFLGTRSPPAVFLLWKSAWIKMALAGLRWQRKMEDMSDPSGLEPVRVEYARFNPTLGHRVAMQGHCSYSGLHPLRQTPLMAAFFHNVSALKDAVDEVAEGKKHAERLNKELRLKNEDLKKAEQARMRFVASVSHELRTPMNGIIGLTNTLLEDNATNLVPEQVEALNLIRQCGDTLLRNVSDILLFSRLTSLDQTSIQLHPHSFSLRDAISRACGLLELRARNEGVRFAVEIEEGVPAQVVADEARLCGTVLGNLVSNAVKFVGGQGKGGDVVVCVEKVALLDSGGVRLKFSVLDSGPGIPEDKRAAIFRPFASFVSDRFPVATDATPLPTPTTTVTSSDLESDGDFLSPFGANGGSSNTLRSSGELSLGSKGAALKMNSYLPSEGTGLGLVIVRQMVELLGGTVGFCSPRRGLIARSEAGEDRYEMRGTEFWVVLDVGVACEMVDGTGCLDLNGAEALPKLPRQRTLSDQFPLLPKPAVTRALRILVAEDNPINLRVLLRFLERISRSLSSQPPFDIATAIDGLAAVHAFSEHSPDLILLDLAMPKLSGVEAAREIRRLAGAREVKIVAVTANVLDSERDECLADGLMDGFVGKPVVFEELKGLVERCGVVEEVGELVGEYD